MIYSKRRDHIAAHFGAYFSEYQIESDNCRNEKYREVSRKQEAEERKKKLRNAVEWADTLIEILDEKEEPEVVAGEIMEVLIKDLMFRNSFEYVWEGMDEGIQEDMKKKWVHLILEKLKKL